MARVTVEDCVDKVENRFELVLLAAHRARMISSGASIFLSIVTRIKTRWLPCERSRTSASTPDDLKEELIHSLAEARGSR